MSPTPERARASACDVALAGVNFGDTHQREGQYIAGRELPFVLGGEVVGTVEEHAPAQVGERVVALLETGGYAERAVAPAERDLRHPRRPRGSAALALLIQGLTAWHLYRTAAKLADGESVVVHSAAGGVGGLAVQLAKPMGAGRVIATAGSPERRARALELGADAAVDPAPEDLAAALVEANGGEPVDVVLETAGGRVFEHSLAGARPLRAAGGLRQLHAREGAGVQRRPAQDQPGRGRVLARCTCSTGRS